MSKLKPADRLRIAYFSYARLPSRSANSIHVMRMCSAFAKLGHDVTLYVPAFSKVEYEDIETSVFDYYGVKNTFRIKKLPWLPVKGRSTIYSWLAAIHARLTRAQLVYARDLKTGYVSSKLGLTVIYEAHAPVKEIDQPIFERLVSSGQFKRLIVISDALRKIYEKSYPQLAGKVQVAHDAADIEEHDVPQPADSVRMRVGYVGHLYQGRGIELIIGLAARCPWADFEIVGGMDDDVNFWKSRSQNIGNIHFHGHLPYSDAARVRQSCQVLLAPFARKLAVYGGGTDTSQWMSPMKIFEYMASGKAIICSELPVLTEVLEHEKTALLCEPENIDDWQQALERIRDEPDLASDLGVQAYAQLKRRHTWSVRARDVLSGI